MFSVVIPAYNCENTIVATIDSVLRQTRIDLIEEIIVVNDGSEDQTEKIYGIRSLKHNGKRIGESLVFLKSDPQIWVDLGKPMHIDSVLCSIDITSPIPDRVIDAVVIKRSLLYRILRRIYRLLKRGYEN